MQSAVFTLLAFAVLCHAMPSHGAVEAASRRLLQVSSSSSAGACQTSAATVNHGTITCPRNKDGTDTVPRGGTCSLACDKGYFPSTQSATVTCIAGTFTKDTTCIGQPCDATRVKGSSFLYVAVDNGTIKCDGNKYGIDKVPSGDTCSVTCENGFKPSTSTISCIAGTFTTATCNRA